MNDGGGLRLTQRQKRETEEAGQARLFKEKNLSFDVFLKAPLSLCVPQVRLLGAVGESRKKPKIPIDKPL